MALERRAENARAFCWGVCVRSSGNLTVSPEELREQLRGLLAFSVTPFGDDRELDLARFKEHLRYMIGAAPHGLFVCEDK